MSQIHADDPPISSKSGPLTPDQLRTFASEGYLAIESFVPDQLVDPVVRDVCEFVSADLDDSSTWFNNDPENYTQVPIHHPQSFWDVRQFEPIYRAFAQLWDEEDLLVSIDRGSLKPPWSDEHVAHNLGRRIHWDVDPIGMRRQIQGVLYLTDNKPGGGCFECVPGVHDRAAQWMEERGFNRDSYFRLDVRDDEVMEVVGPKGTFVFFDSRLPHGSGANHSSVPRLAQYVQMYPRRDEPEMDDRIECWKSVRAPRWSADEGWVGLQDPEPFPRPILSDFGKQLLGLTAP